MALRGLATAAAVSVLLAACDPQAPRAADGPGGANGASAQLSAPAGFRVTVYHPGVGTGARHLVVRDNGDVLVARREGILVALRDADGDGRAERVEERELPITTGLALHAGYLYFSDDTSVRRLSLTAALMPAGQPETVVAGFPEQSSHAAKTLALDPAGRLYVNVGAPSNACQAKPRTPGSPGLEPCPQLDRQAGIWRFLPGAVDLHQSDGERFVTGTRNVIAMDWSPAAGALFFVMHGRDQLASLWPDLFGVVRNAETPAEELHRAVAGQDYGWPRTFFDPATGRRLLAPEYGGDGEEAVDPDAYPEPLQAFPAHWAPNDLVFYPAGQFPERYHGGAFIAWHGSWNRAPLPQQGYRVSFLPFAGGAPAGPAEDFLTGFPGADEIAQPGEADYRPMGLGVGPDGALYVGDSVHGRIWKVSYPGSAARASVTGGSDEQGGR